MKRLVLVCLAVLLLTAPEATAICQTCNNNGTLAAQCWVAEPKLCFGFPSGGFVATALQTATS